MRTARAKAAARWRLAGSRAAAQGQSPLRYALRALLRRVLPRGASASGADRRAFPLVSVIVFAPDTGDDGGERLEAAARSALERSYDPIELIVVPRVGGGAAPVLQRLAANPWVHILHQEPSSPGSRLSSAVLAARGELVTWMSADYLLDPTAIGALVEAIMADPTAGLVHTNVASTTVEGKGEAVPSWALYRRAGAIALSHALDVDLAGPPAAALHAWAGVRHVPDAAALCTRRPFWSPRREAEPLPARFDPPQWRIACDDTVGAADRAALEAAEAQRPATVRAVPGAVPGMRTVRVIGAADAVPGGLFIRALTDAWQLAWRSKETGGEVALTFWKGLVLRPSVREARGRRRRLAAAGKRPVVGCHLDLAAFPADVETVRRIIGKSSAVFFVFADSSDAPPSGLGERLVAGLENAAFLGRRPFGEPGELYGTWSAVWLPPRLGTRAEGDVDGPYRMSLALAYAIGRPFVGPRALRFIPAPRQYFYHPDESMGFVADLDRVSYGPILLDAYLERWTPGSCLQEVLNHAGALLDDARFDPRRREPDLLAPPPSGPAPAWQAAGHRRASRVLLAADTLDTGGLEETVAQLAVHLRRRGREVAVTAVKSAGVMARRLSDQGIRVYVADGDPRVIRDVLARERPDIVNSHLASLEMLQQAADRGIPVVEAIQNTYVWFDHELWRTETTRSRTFSRAIAVSGLVRAYYAKWNPAFPTEWVQIVPNAVDLDRLLLVDRSRARQQLGIAQDEVVFLSLASYVPQKNQFGLLGAFEEAALQRPRIRLVCVGNVGDRAYYDRLLGYRQRMRAGKQVDLQFFEDDVAVLLSAADVFVLNSFFEGWSVAASEALVAGLPVIHSDCGSARELVGDGTNGILIPNPAVDPLDLTWKDVSRTQFKPRQRNAAALIEAMTRFVDEREEWRRRAPDITARARRSLSFEASALRYEALFDAVVSGSA